MGNAVAMFLFSPHNRKIKEVVHLAQVIALSSHLNHQIPSTADILLLLLCVGFLSPLVAECLVVLGNYFLDISIEKKKKNTSFCTKKLQSFKFHYWV